MKIIKPLIKNIWYLFFDRSPHQVIGFILHIFLPAKVKKIESNFFDSSNWSFSDRCIGEEISYKYYHQPESKIKKENRQKFWGASHSKAWHDYQESEARINYNERMKYKIRLIEWIGNLVEKNNIPVIFEIGTGMGQFLFIIRDCTQKHKCNYIGFDLNKDCILEAKKRNSFEDTQFYHGDACKYIAENGKKNTLYVFCGTLEYFTQNELESLLRLINSHSPSFIAICDTITMNRDKEFESKPRGRLAYSHNYEYLLEKHHYSIIEKDIQQIDPEKKFYECIIILAQKN